MAGTKSQRRTDGKFILIKKIKPRAFYRKTTSSLLRSTPNSLFSEDVLKVIGNNILISIRAEISKVSNLGHGVPKTKAFKDSFFYTIENDSKGILRLYIHSDWSWVGRYLKERGEIKMTWITGLKDKRGKRQVIPIKDKKTGKMVFRSVPLKTKSSWIHPAINKYNFIENGIRKGQQKSISAISLLLERKLKQ